MPKICGIFSFEKNVFSISESAEKFSDNKVEIIADTILTNRTELLRKFGVFSSKENTPSDAELILKSYEKWGESCIEHLAGDFAFAIWDKQNRQLFCSRDHFGASTLFFLKDDKRFIIASEIKDILDFENVGKRFNANKLASLLIPEPHTYLTDQTWFENIQPFPSGTSFTVNSNGIKTKQYWKPKQQKVFDNRTDKDILEQFRELFFEIISARLNNETNSISLLSGGLDSSAIVSVAAKILERQNKELTVFAGVLENKNDSQFDDERYYIDQFRSVPNVNIKYISATTKGPFSDLDDFFDHYHSPFISSRHYLYRSFTSNAHELGAETIFDGSFGETGATFHGEGGFAEMFSSFKWLTLWRELNLRKKIYRDSIKYNFRAHTINPLLPQFLKNLKHSKVDQLNQFHFIKEDLAHSLIKNINIEQFLPKPTSPNTQTNQINEMSFIQKKFSDAPTNRFGKTSVEIRYPFRDKRLIEFTQSIPLHLKIRNGYNRYLIRSTLDGILPSKIQWRTTKTPFSPDYVRRFNSQIDEVKDYLADIKSNDPICDILDIEKIKRWANLPVDDTERYTTGEMLAREQIPQAIYLIYFLRKFSEFRT